MVCLQRQPFRTYTPSTRFPPRRTGIYDVMGGREVILGYSVGVTGRKREDGRGGSCLPLRTPASSCIDIGKSVRRDGNVLMTRFLLCCNISFSLCAGELLLSVMLCCLFLFILYFDFFVDSFILSYWTPFFFFVVVEIRCCIKMFMFSFSSLSCVQLVCFR